MPGIDDLVPYNFKNSFSPRSLFNRLISEGSIKFNLGFASLDTKNNDIPRIHDIVFAIDDRRAFYDPFGDESPEEVVKSVYETKKDVYNKAQGLWTNLWAETVIRRILHDIGEFQTKIAKPLPKQSDSAGYAAFEEQLLELRLKVWTAIAHFVVVYGDSVPAYHIPPEIVAQVREIYGAE